jgi:hypothetical protein
VENYVMNNFQAYYSPNFITVIKLRMMRTTIIGEIRNEYIFLPRIYNGKQHLGNLDIDRRIILKFIFEKYSLKL